MFAKEQEHPADDNDLCNPMTKDIELEETHRLFVSLSVGEKARTQIATLQNDINVLNPTQNIRWQEQPHIHITIQFLGNVNVSAIRLIRCKLDKLAKSFLEFPLDLGELKHFQQRGSADIMWLELRESHNTLIDLMQQSKFMIHGFGDHLPDKNPIPHITIGRRKTSELPLNLPPFPLPSSLWIARTLNLNRSIIRAGKLDHLIIHQAPFAKLNSTKTPTHQLYRFGPSGLP